MSLWEILKGDPCYFRYLREDSTTSPKCQKEFVEILHFAPNNYYPGNLKNKKYKVECKLEIILKVGLINA
jgi:hypothetical protein